MSRILKLVPHIAPKVGDMPAHAEWGDGAHYAAGVELPAMVGIIQVAMRGKVVTGDHCTYLHPTRRYIKKHCGFHILKVELAVWSHFILMQSHGQINLELVQASRLTFLFTSPWVRSVPGQHILYYRL